MDFNSLLKDLNTYEAGKPIELVVREYGIDPKDIIKLASNENPYGTSPKVTKALSEHAHKSYLYPDDSMFELKDALAERFDVSAKNIIIGAGSDQVIEFIVHAKANPKNAILCANTTFAMYEIYARSVGAHVIKTPSDQHNLDEFLRIYQENDNISVIFLCLPNNPLGEALDTKDVYSFLEQIDSNTLVVIDGAYQEYASFKDSKKHIKPHELLKKFPNTIYLGTFSKAYGLGGLRVGYGIASENIMENLYKIRPPFNVTTLSLTGALEALKDEAFVQRSIAQNFEQMKRYEDFANKKHISYIDSYTNFITLMLDKPHDSSHIAQTLLKRGIIIRDLRSYGLNAIRITIGTKEQNDIFFTHLNEVLGV